jgi:hypothetical protein
MKVYGCYSCGKEINKQADLYYLVCALRTNMHYKDTKFLHFCDTCFHSSADSCLIDRLNALSIGDVAGTKTDNWRTCPYCKDTLPYAKVNIHFQVSEIMGSELNSIALHSKCYYQNIGIREDDFTD